jgi:hypothetical protein
MLFISHRGNIDHQNHKRENTKNYILEALALGFDCEIDIWVIDNIIYLGHDNPVSPIDIQFLLNNKEHLWIHCKNFKALDFFSKNTEFNYFYHDKDHYTITSKSYIWGNINSHIINNMICVMPEKYTVLKSIKNCYGICSDYIQKFKTEYT